MKTLGIQTNQGWRIFTLAAQQVKSPHLRVIKYWIFPTTCIMFPVVERKGNLACSMAWADPVFCLSVCRVESSESNAKAVDLPKVNEVIICSQLPVWSPFRLKSA